MRQPLDLAPMASAEAPAHTITSAQAEGQVRASSRDPYIDTLRALAIVRVFVYHALGLPWLLIVFPSVPVMLALAGSLMASSLDRGEGMHVIRSRLRRLLPPVWGLAAVAVPLMLYMGWTNWEGEPLEGLDFAALLFWLFPIGDPPTSAWGDELGSPLWYLRAYVWLVLLSPVLLWNFRRWPLATALAPLGLLLLLETSIDAWGHIGNVIWGMASYGTCWMIGFAAHDRLLSRISARQTILIAAVSASLGLLWAVSHPDPEDPALFADPLGETLWAAAIVLLLMRFPISMAWLARIPPLARFVDGFNARAVTIYIWHMPCLFLADTLLDTNGGDQAMIVGAGLTGLAVIAFGWIEDIAARRHPSMFPPEGRH